LDLLGACPLVLTNGSFLRSMTSTTLQLGHAFCSHFLEG
jgi:hypothetical protein